LLMQDGYAHEVRNELLMSLSRCKSSKASWIKGSPA
jgi:hypothetical protein